MATFYSINPPLPIFCPLLRSLHRHHSATHSNFALSIQLTLRLPRIRTFVPHLLSPQHPFTHMVLLPIWYSSIHYARQLSFYSNSSMIFSFLFLSICVAPTILLKYFISRTFSLLLSAFFLPHVSPHAMTLAQFLIQTLFRMHPQSSVAQHLIIYHDFLPTPRRGSHVKSDNTNTQSSRYTP